MPQYTLVTVERGYQDRIATVTMHRPEVRNAINTQLVQELLAAFADLRGESGLHAVILTGDGTTFSAGADLNMMKASVALSEEQNVSDALTMARLFDAINTFPCPVIGRINGTAMGGGLGLVSVCDIVVAVESAQFAFSEVRLGIAPAVISPYVLRKIGESQTRMLFVTGESFSADYARQIGLVHIVTAPEELDVAVEKKVNELLRGAPQAMRACKSLALNVGNMDGDTASSYTAETIAHLRAGEEGQEGLRAFLEKRKPNWIG